MANNKVVLKGTGIRHEALASGAITPGHLVEMTTASADTVKVHATAGGNCEKAFAVEDDLQGNDIADVYASGSIVQYEILRPGDEVYAILANGQNATKGAFLESAGDGTLQVHAADNSAAPNLTNQIVAIAREAVNMSGSSGADPSGRIRVRIV